MAESRPASDGDLVATIAAQIDDASAEEAAAIAGAISAHLLDRERAAMAAAAAANQDDGEAWAGKRWSIAGRLARNRRPADRIPRDAPGNAWALADRRDRY